MTTTGLGLERILVPLDGSAVAEQSIPYVAALAADNAEITFIQVVSEGHSERDMLGHVVVPAGEVGHRSRMQGLDHLRDAADRWRSILPVEPRFEVSIGDPIKEIIATAKRLSCELIAVASHGRGGVRRLAVGSVAHDLARSSPVPVLLIRARDDAGNGQARLDRIVVPYDGSQLASAAIPAAIDLAKRIGSGIFLIQVISPTDYAPMPATTESYFPSAAYEETIELVEQNAESELKTVADVIQNAGVEVKHAVVPGAPAEALIDQTRHEDLIVMTSHGRSGLKRLFMGSVAEHLVRHGHAPVVVVPAGDRQ
jgi:nucleotide-binding universal stress UspA family protein